MNGPLDQEPAAPDDGLVDPGGDPAGVLDAHGAPDPADPGDDLDGADADAADTAEAPPGSKDLEPDILNDDLAPDRADPGEVAPTSDPDPADEAADFPGRPLTDAEIDALPPDEDNGPG